MLIINKIIYICRDEILNKKDSFFNDCMRSYDWVDSETKTIIFDLCVRHYAYYVYYAQPVLGENIKFNSRLFAMPLAGILRKKLKRIRRDGATMTQLAVLGSGMTNAWRLARLFDQHIIDEFREHFPVWTM